MAAEFLSQSMADAVNDIYGKDSSMGKFSDLLRKVDNTFDAFNSSSEGKAGQTKPRKCGYGKHLELQERTLVDFRAYILQIMILNKANLNRIEKGKKGIGYQPWQKGFAISCTSLMALFTDLVEEYGITWFPTTSVNQDLVECLFSILRALGGNDVRFGGLSYLWRLRLVILGKCSKNFYYFNSSTRYPRSKIAKKLR